MARNDQKWGGVERVHRVRKAVSALRFGRVPMWWNQRKESGPSKGSATGLGMRLRNLSWRTGKSVKIICLIPRPEWPVFPGRECLWVLTADTKHWGEGGKLGPP